MRTRHAVLALSAALALSGGLVAAEPAAAAVACRVDYTLSAQWPGGSWRTSPSTTSVTR